ncbi:kelch domain-containing protein 1-like [Littorina saxatilis]|uniref:kelch domain-containing protein 1-like n=1 Tax=Littorina saxatilis TaxID=31220 RepID=UPI0038B5C719
MGEEAASSVKVGNDIVVDIRKAKNEFPFPAREGCVACGLGTKVYVFGGVIQGDHAEPQETNDLLLFNIESETWQKVKGSGTLPPPRAAASLVAVGTKLYLFGGLSHMTGWFDDLFVFDTETVSWSVMETQGNKPRARDKLQGVAIGTNIYYFGGFGPKSDGFEDMEEGDEDEEEEEEETIPEAQEQQGAEFGWFNDLYILDTVNKVWKQPIQMNLGVPTPRAAHGMCAIGNNLYIFGGRDIRDRQNDLHCFDTVTRKWDTELKPKGAPPGPRSFHTAVAAGSRVVIMGGRGRDNSHFGDVQLFDTETQQWLQPQMKGVAMTPRGQHVTVATGNTVVVFGGTGNFSPETMQCQQFYTDTFLVSAEDLGKGAAQPVTNGSGDA